MLERLVEFSLTQRLLVVIATLALVGEFADAGAWRTYLAHPAHRAVVTEHVEPVVAARQSVQFIAD